VNTKARPRANIIFILVDDMGWRDLSCTGSIYYETPHVDSLARSGMMFTQAYEACSLCSPSRAAIFTGKAPARIGLTQIVENDSTARTLYKDYRARMRSGEACGFLSPDELTIGKVLRKEGYATCFLGKWHLGHDDPYFPDKHGFDVALGHCYEYRNPHFGRWPGQVGFQDMADDDYMPERLTDEALNFIDQQAEEPFFLFLSHWVPHLPAQGKPELVEYYANKQERDDQCSPEYASMVDAVDRSVGRITGKLAELGILDNTMVIFTSDNGGLEQVRQDGRWICEVPEDLSTVKMITTSNRPLLGGKSLPFEAGTRVPLLISWPGQISPASRCDTPVIGMDFYPTILDMIGLPLLPEQHMDGVSLACLLRQNGSLADRPMYWHFPHYTHAAGPYCAMISEDRWKCIEFFEDDGCLLYDLTNDPYERHDLAREEESRARTLRRRMAEWRTSVGASMPSLQANSDTDGLMRGREYSLTWAEVYRDLTMRMRERWG
jgi:arylsulfatase A